MHPLESADRLRERLGEPGLSVVDCRWRLGEPGAGERDYFAGHVPGAAFLDVDTDLAAPPGEGGRHPLPSAEQFEAAARRAGIGADSRVLALDEAGEGGAARLWWLLRHFGHERVAVLDGGMRAWRAAGGPLRAGPEHIPEGDFRARPPADRPADTATAEELAGRLSDPALLLLDARTPERYRGEREPVDPVAGRLPGAVNLHFGELAPNGAFPPPEQLRARLEAAGAGAGRDAVAYCGSGVTATTLVLATELAGLPRARLFPGSWSEWCARELPAERG